MRLIDFGSLSKDEQGNTIIQFVLVLPIFILVVFGSYEIWKLVHLKQSLEAATIQATRYLSVEGPFFLDDYPEGWRQRAWRIVAGELENESLIEDQFESAVLRVDVSNRFRSGRPECPGDEAKYSYRAVNRAERSQFAVHSELQVPWSIQIPFVDTPDNLVLTETHWHYLECPPPYTEPTPTPTP